MTTKPQANARTTQPALITTEPATLNAAGLTPTAAWSRRVRRIGGFIQTAFAAFWLARASLAIGGHAGDVLAAASAVAVTGVVYLISDLLFGSQWAAVATAGVAGWFAWFWYGLPLTRPDPGRGKTDPPG